MARKKAKNSSGTGILIIIALAFGALASIPKNAWIAVGIVACIGAIMWFLATRTKRQLEQLQKSASVTTHLQEPRSKDVTFSMHEVSLSNMSEETSEFYTVQLGSPLPLPLRFQMQANKNPILAGCRRANRSLCLVFLFPAECSM